MNLPRSLANLNGVEMPLEEVRIPALDRGFLFGDAVYEVLRIYRGKPWLMNDHWQRLARSLEAIRIRGVDLRRVQERMLATIAAGKFQEAIAYIQITRGTAPRKHAFPTEIVPLEFLYVQEFTDSYAPTAPQRCGRHHPARFALAALRRQIDQSAWQRPGDAKRRGSRLCGGAALHRRRHTDGSDSQQLFRGRWRHVAGDAIGPRDSARNNSGVFGAIGSGGGGAVSGTTP